MKLPIPLEKIYDVSYSTVKIDFSKYPELDVNIQDNVVQVFLQSAIYDYEENLGKTLTVDFIKEEITTEDVPQAHIKLLGQLIYKNYLERELNYSLQIANQFNKKSELNVTGMPTKINALRDCLSRLETKITRSFTRSIMKGVSKS